VEGFREDSQRQSLPARLSGRTTAAGDGRPSWTWQQRLRRTMSFPDHETASEFLSEVALPAVTRVSEELREYGVEAEVRDGRDESGYSYVELVADLGEEEPFQYRVAPQEAETPVYGDRTSGGGDVYYRLDVHLQEGGQGYDVMGYTQSQLIDDILDQYEQHVEFIRLNTEATR